MDYQTETNGNKALENEGQDIFIFFVNFVRSIFKFWSLIAILALLFGSLFFIYSKSNYTPIYRSETTFTVTTGNGSSLDTVYNFYSNASSAEQLGLTFPHILSSQLLTDAIKQDLGTDVINGSITAETLKSSNMVTMSVIGENPDEIKRILESTLKVYPSAAKFVLGEIKFNTINPPTYPTEPYNRPTYIKNVLMGIGVGAALALIIIAVYAYLRKTIHRENELQNKFNIQCLTSLPLVTIKERKSVNDKKFFTIHERNISPWFAENAEALWLRVETALAPQNKKVILVTSTVDGEGKSTVAANLALSIAQHDKRVILIDADLRKQTLGANLGFEAYNLNAEIESHDDICDIIRTDVKHNLMFIGGSVKFKNISQFLLLKLSEIINSVRNKADYIVIDSPSMSLYEDTLRISKYADAVLYVIKQDFAPKNRIIDTITEFENESVPVIGYVFNGVTGILGEYSDNRYGYGKYGKYGSYGSYGKFGYSRYGYGKYGYGKYGYDYHSKKREASNKKDTTT